MSTIPPRSRLVRVGALVATAALALAACSSSDASDEGSDAEPTTTTVALTAAEAAQAYTEPGPYPVGITTLELADGAEGVKVEVWYPAVEGSTGTDSYDLRELIPDAVTQLLTADVPAVMTIDAARDAEAAEGTFPLVLFSHGFSGVRQQSSFLTAHLASWGMVVAAPDHWDRDLYHVLGRVLGEGADEVNDPVDDLRFTRELMEQETTTAGGRLEGRIDLEQVAAVGHSAGGGSVLQLAADEGIDGYVSMASGARLGGDDADTTASTAPPVLPDVPSLFMAGSVDEVVPVDTATRPAYEAAPAPSRLWVLDGVGHNGFDDFCTFGNGRGIIGVAEASGLGAFLDAQPQFRSLGEDGCIEPAVPVTTTFPIVEHAVTAWLRNLFGVDAEPVGLGPEVAGEYPVKVTIEERLQD